MAKKDTLSEQHNCVARFYDEHTQDVYNSGTPFTVEAAVEVSKRLLEDGRTLSADYEKLQAENNDLRLKKSLYQCGECGEFVVATDLETPCPYCERVKLQEWIADLQAGMFINCVYCGHCYGPRENTSVSMADLLTAHIEVCPAHPLSKARAVLERVLEWHEGPKGFHFPAAEVRAVLNKETCDG